jgi:hypothetical protein
VIADYRANVIASCANTGAKTVGIYPAHQIGKHRKTPRRIDYKLKVVYACVHLLRRTDMYKEFERWFDGLRVAINGKSELQGFSLETKELMYMAWLAGRAKYADLSALESLVIAAAQNATEEEEYWRE